MASMEARIKAAQMLAGGQMRAMGMSAAQEKALGRAIERGTYVKHIQENPRDLQWLLRGILEFRWVDPEVACTIMEKLVREAGLDLHGMIEPGKDHRSPAEAALLTPKVLEHMIKHLGLQVNRRLEVYGGTLLHTVVFMWQQMPAAGSGASMHDVILETVQVLLEGGCDPNTLDIRGSPPLEYALSVVAGTPSLAKLVAVLLPRTTCMPLYAGLPPDELATALARPVEEVFNEALRATMVEAVQQDGVSVLTAPPSARLRVLLASLTFRLPSFDHLLMLLPLVGEESFCCEWIAAAGSRVDKASGGVETLTAKGVRHGPARIHSSGDTSPLRPALVNKFAKHFAARPGDMGLWALWTRSKTLRGFGPRLGELGANLHKGAAALAARLRASEGALPPGIPMIVVRAVCRVVSNILLESGSRLPPGAHPAVRGFVDAGHWRDLLTIMGASGMSEQDKFVEEVAPSLCEQLIYAMPSYLLTTLPAFLEEIQSGLPQVAAGRMADVVQGLAKVVQKGKTEPEIPKMAAVNQIATMVMAASTMLSLPQGSKTAAVREGGMTMEGVEQAQRRIEAGLQALKGTQLWAALQAMHSAAQPGPPAKLKGGDSAYKATVWREMVDAVEGAMQPSTVPIRVVQQGDVAKESLSRGNDDKEVEAAIREAERAADARAVRRQFDVTCAQCGKTAAEAGLPQLLRCSLCKGPSYCGAACQKLHWRAGHKQECKRS
uniref:MYND-type domain-containing protein n=1 Tax=Chlamydomonas leiostraca TaxID=1034604 RepID=A0A7S0R2F6_9CHLO|mmetsp:Transcript_12255/g.29882  ORF Transcript_12255/g.29882 Transcript_12255/m.29882 type:complete len:721 (+) Transcript_12255:27-2189(+)